MKSMVDAGQCNVM